MNEQLQATVNEILTKSMEAFDQGASWMAGEIPEVLSQLLAWNFTQSLVLSIFSWVVIISITIASFKIPKKARIARSNKESWTQGKHGGVSGYFELATIIPYVFCGVTWFFVFMAYSTGGGLVWLKIAVAPKLFLLEYAADLIK